MTDQPPPDDEPLDDLIEKARTGDRSAFERLITRLAVKVTRLAKRFVPLSVQRRLDADAIATEAAVAVLALYTQQDHVGPQFLAQFRHAARSRIRDEVYRLRLRTQVDRLLEFVVDHEMCGPLLEVGHEDVISNRTIITITCPGCGAHLAELVTVAQAQAFVQERGGRFSAEDLERARQRARKH